MCIGQARFISTLDLTKGYWHIPMAPQDKEKTDFVAPWVLIQFRQMPFSVHGAAASFQRLMDKVLAPHQNYASTYIDDIVILSPDWDQHFQQLHAILTSLREVGLTANPKKYALGQYEIQYLRVLVGQGKIKSVVDKVEAIKKYLLPKT